jgi:hypothetical protein
VAEDTRRIGTVKHGPKVMRIINSLEEFELNSVDMAMMNLL